MLWNDMDDITWFDVKWYGIWWCAKMWYDMIWCDVMWFDVMWCDVKWCNVIWCDVMWYDMIWYDMIWYDMSYHCANSNVLSNTSYTNPLFIARLNWLAFAWFGIRFARPSGYFPSHHNCSCFYFILCISWTITWFTQPRPPTSYLTPTIRHRKMHHVRAFSCLFGATYQMTLFISFRLLNWHWGSHGHLWWFYPQTSFYNGILTLHLLPSSPSAVLACSVWCSE